MGKDLKDRSGWVQLAGTYRGFPALAGESKGGLAGDRRRFHRICRGARGLPSSIRKDRIMLIDRKRLGQGASGRNSGFAVMVEMPGPAEATNPTARAAYQRHAEIHKAAGTK